MPRLAQSSKPSTNTVAEYLPVIQKWAEGVPAVPDSIFGRTFTFRLRQHVKGNFPGLWELAILDEKGNISKLISDADALNFCMDNLMGELETEGY